MRAQALQAVIGLLVSTQATLAACDVPTFGPTVVDTGPKGEASPVLIVAGVIGICDAALRSFSIDLPDLPGIQTASVQLSLAGFSRRYGVHQIGFVLQSEKAIPTQKGVLVNYGATVDGLERYQLAYTLYLTPSH